ncbi:MAG: hypothetical protein PHR35_15175 [Kiritimatiellae bacterium]|nr:hypothetical protein [Kiritimatiellia bacterium]
MSKIKAFNIDFNWGFDAAGNFGPATPGMYAAADPEEHVKWYADLGVNVIQSFCVSYNGYAWYRGSSVAPVAPGMAHDFLPEMTTAAHGRGIRVMGYFCLGANRVWEAAHPEQVHAQAPMWKLPLTRNYLDYFCRSVQDALRKTEVDGFMVDWFMPPERNGVWLDCDKTMWRELMGERFPVSGTPDAATQLEFERREIERAWDALTGAIREVRPALVWVNSIWENSKPLWEGHRALREMDWVLNESHRLEQLDWLERQAGPRTRIIQNMGGGGATTDAEWSAFDGERFGLYAFVQADPVTTFPDDTEVNRNNIARIRARYSARIRTFNA